MPSSSDTGVSDTLDPMAIVSDDRVSSEREVYTSDTTSTDDDDFQPFALPDVGAEPADEHDPVHDDAPAVAPLVDDIPIADHPIVATPLVDDHIDDAPVDAPLLMEDPVVAPLPDPVPVLFDRAPFATHIDPRYADTRNGWIDDDDDYPAFVLPVTPPAAPVLALVLAPISAPIDIPPFPPHITDAHRTDLPVTFLHDIPPPRPGEGSSRQPPIPVPPMMSSPFPFTSQFPTVTPPTAPSFTPSSEPFLWTTPLSCYCLIRITHTMLGTPRRTSLLL
ncbi:WAS/WASL-interacting protein family member 3-like [Helianthus annuus]|uniref:WAS/WASL-interacting protein family member 3-like n=1 Tax=Helianthus annuus TaxID=4232 RepID=UPI001652D67C|nr:WAS/WASL-interacting protein family member 3-like [Helianthus annuus]